MITLIKKSLTFGLILSVVGLTGCAGRTPNPVMVYQPDDNYMSCDEIRNEIEQNQLSMHKLYPQTQKTGKNVALGVTGAFFLVPLFFMDFSDAEKVEINAFQQRDLHLHRLAERKQCNSMPPRVVIKYRKK